MVNHIGVGEEADLTPQQMSSVKAGARSSVVDHVVVFKPKVLHFKTENTSINDTNGKRKYDLHSRINKIILLSNHQLFSIDKSRIKAHFSYLQAIPPFFFRLASKAFRDIGSVGLEKKTYIKNHKKCRNRRPWYARITFKVNIHIFGLKCTICCEKCLCLCSCFSLCCYYAHFSD